MAFPKTPSHSFYLEMSEKKAMTMIEFGLKDFFNLWLGEGEGGGGLVEKWAWWGVGLSDSGLTIRIDQPFSYLLPSFYMQESLAVLDKMGMSC